MKRTRFLMFAAALGLVPAFGGGTNLRLPEAIPSSASDQSFPLQAIARAADAQADDNFGSAVAVSGSVAIVGAYFEDGGPGDPRISAGAAYIFRRNKDGAAQWGQVKKLIASDTQESDQFGFAVDVSGDLAIVGAHFEDGGIGDPLDSSGAAYIFRRDQGGPANWGQVQKLTAPDPQPDDRFGRSVVIDGDIAIVSAEFEDGGPGDPTTDAGAAYVFQNVAGHGWLHVKTLRSSDSQASDFFGHDLAISGAVAIVGAHKEDGGPGSLTADAGAAYIFQRDKDGANEWGEVEKLVAADPGIDDLFGNSVAISGKLALVGAHLEDGGPSDPIRDAGAAYVFENLTGLGWTQVKILTVAEAEPAMNLGFSVAVSGGIALVGTVNDNGGIGGPLPQAGAVYVFMRHLGGVNAWGQAKKLAAQDAQPNDNFGFAMAISGRNVIVGALREDGGIGDPINNAGAAYVYYVSLLKAFKAN